MGETIITPLPRGLIGSAVSLLTDAFRDDPIFCFHFPQAGARKKVLGLFFSDVIRAHLRHGHVYAALDGEGLVGAAVWRPPGAADGLADRMRAWLTRQRLLAMSPQAGHLLLQGFAELERTHPQTPHWYLFFIGVDLGRRGDGIGARLMAPVLAMADRDATPSRLETPFPQTLPFYRKLGFEVAGELRPFVGAPPLWAMMRKPRAVQ